MQDKQPGSSRALVVSSSSRALVVAPEAGLQRRQSSLSSLFGGRKAVTALTQAAPETHEEISLKQK